MAAKKSYFFITIVSIMMFSFGAAVNAATDMKLIGMAIQEKYRMPIFYAAVYSDNINQESDLYFPNYPIRMESRFTVERFSSRQSNQLWIESILINSPRTVLDSLSDEIVKFSNMIKLEFVKGDQLVFDYHPSKGTEILLNNVTLGLIENIAFQPVLTASWFGKRAPSKTFGEDIRKKPSNKMLQIYEKLQASAARIAEIKSLYSGSISVADAPNKKEVAIKVAKAVQPPSNAIKPKAESETSLKPKAKPKAKSKSNNAKTRSKIKPKKQVSKASVKKSDSEKSRSNISNIVDSSDANKASETRASQPSTLDKSSQLKPSKKSSALDDVIKGLEVEYIEEVKSYIENKAQPTPPRQVRKKPAHDALVRVVIERLGSNVKVVSSEIIQGEFEPKLVEALKKSITILKRFPSMPESINKDKLTIDVNLGFAKCKRSTSAWICF